MWWMMGLVATAQAERHTWARSIQRLDLENLAGDLHVERGGERIEVQLVRVRDRSCAIKLGERLGEARIRIADETGRSAGCRVNVAVRLPTTATARISLGAGDVHTVDLDARLELSVGAGDVRLEGARRLSLELGAGDIEGHLAGASCLRVGAGNIDVHGLVEPVTAQVGTGRIRLRFARAPGGRISATTGLGEVLIDLPGPQPRRTQSNRRPSDRKNPPCSSVSG